MKKNKQMFFILGSVRSGTTLLRNILREHPNLICPEETHIFRWADPFNSNDYKHIYQVGETLKLHRKMDGINEQDFNHIYDRSIDRKDFMINYMELFKKVQGNSDCRYFDKTPQNIYGLSLIKAYFPDAKIIHIVRNPLNVISSLKRGRGLLPQNIIGAINFWKESILIFNTLRPLLKDNLYELHYEDLANNPATEISNLLKYLGEEQFDMNEIISQVIKTKDSYNDVLSANEIKLVIRELFDFMKQYGY
jgi:hypothetical protein